MHRSFPAVFVSFLVFITISIVSGEVALAQRIYSKAYGQKGDPAIVYLHGGPRGNATLFEGTTAAALAKRGFYVVVYDRRGEGRSADPQAKVTYNEAFADLNSLLNEYGLAKVSLLGHSFGGLVATLYADRFPEKVERLILVGALFAQQESYDHILASSLKIAVSQGDTTAFKKISHVKTMNKESEQYRKQTYEVASHFGFFKMPKPTEASKKLNFEYENSRFSKSNIRNDKAPVLFYENEPRVNIDTKPNLKSIVTKKIEVAAIYGLQDGIFSAKQLSDLKKLVGPQLFYAIDNCSHYPFVDQQNIFLKDVQEIMRR